jgi:hypothetical protein
MAIRIYPTSKVLQLVIAPQYKQALLFIKESGWDPNYVRIVTQPEQLYGLRLEHWEVWWLDRLWPCRTHEDVQHMEFFMHLARSCGADIRRWWT